MEYAEWIFASYFLSIVIISLLTFVLLRKTGGNTNVNAIVFQQNSDDEDSSSDESEVETHTAEIPAMPPAA